MTLEQVVGHLRCPHCAADLRIDGATVGCVLGHRYDIARQGYVNLLDGGAGAGTADTAAMVAARVDVFARGHFDPLVAAVAGQARRLIDDTPAGCVVDLGAGPGHYLAAALDRLPERVGLALDLSKHAARRAARAHPRVGAVVCDIWRGLPIRTYAATLALDVFAPRNGDEITRILRPGGALLVVTPTPDHLRELVRPLRMLAVDDDKPARVRGQLTPHLTLEHEAELTFDLTLDHPDVQAVVAMGPSAWHVDADELAGKIRMLPQPVSVTAAVTLSVYRA